MTFTTVTFLVFILIFFTGYWFLAKKTSITLRNLFMIAGGYVFYGWWDWRFLILLIFSSSIDFLSGLAIGSTEIKWRRKIFLALSITVNLALLGFFKYYEFFITSTNDILRQLGYTGSTHALKIILPVGLSFYTFQSMSYALDVYKRKLAPTKNIIDFFAFVSFFPQLVAGPIERAVHMLPQFASKKTFDYNIAASGLRMILWGLFKKMVIADTLASFADPFFEQPLNYNTPSAWLALGCFGFQIYCDFSGYSDIAIGCARLLGFELMVNFKTPYFSRSYGEFWTRWHISLSTWFRDYVFIPLGGSKGSLFRTIINIFVVFILSGFWHGAKYNFLIWGFIHWALLAREKIILSRRPNFKWWPGIVLIEVFLAWVPFRAYNIGLIQNAYQALFRFDFERQGLFTEISIFHYAFLGVFVLFMITEIWLSNHPFNEKIVKIPSLGRKMIYYIMVICILLFANFRSAPSFIYFQF